MPSVADLLAARAASRQYRSDAKRLRAEAEIAIGMGYPSTAKELRYMASIAEHAASVEMRAALTGHAA